MRYFALKVEIPSSWNMNSDKHHAIGSLVYLGRNNQGWDILRLHPKFSHLDNMATAIISVCADINNPDEEKGKKRKGFSYNTNNSPHTVEIELEDIADFFHRLQFCKCITEADEKFSLAQIKKLQSTRKNTNPIQQPLLLSTDRDQISIEESNCAY
jgi:hypothetical protein